MPIFTTVPKETVLPRSSGPSQREVVRQQYRDALSSALEAGRALVIEFDPEDKVLTIRNRVKRAADTLGQPDIVVRQQGTTVIAYRADDAPEDSTNGP